MHQLEARQVAGGRWWDSGLLIVSRIGTRLDPSNVTERLQALLERSERPRQRFHDLQHCAASLPFGQKVPVRTVLENLGHTRLATTTNLYGHIFPAAHRDAAKLMDTILTAVG